MQPQTIPVHQSSRAFEAHEAHEIAQQEDADEAWEEALGAEMERVQHDMDACDVLNEIAEAGDDALAKLMDAYRARDGSKEDHAHYVYLLHTMFEEAAEAHAGRVARENLNEQMKRERQWN